jgi:membrane protease YdiL (CAAX protease family)
MTWCDGRAAGLRDLGARLVDPTRISRNWWILIVCFFPVLNLLAVGISRVLGSDTGPLWSLTGEGALPETPLNLIVFAGFMFLIGPLPEELGWRGFLLDRLLLRFNPWFATLLVGLAWWIWHLPLFVIPGYFEPFGGAPMGPWGYLWDLLVGAILFTWIYMNTGRSILAAVVFHFLCNFSGEFMSLTPEARFSHLVLKTVVGLVILVRWRALTLRHPP